MSTISRWILPSNITVTKHKLEPITIDLTEHIKTILSNSVWDRKFKYGFDTGLKNTESENIKIAKVIIYPRFISGYDNKNRLNEIIKNHCGEIPDYLELDSYKKWWHHKGLVILETEYDTTTGNIPKKEDFENCYPNIEISFLEEYERHIAVLKELKALFIAALNLTFPTRHVISRSINPLIDGLFQITSGIDNYASRISSNSFMNTVSFDIDAIEYLEGVLDRISKVWHYDLWAIKRYLIAVESDQKSMDNLLDLLYSLESLFPRNTSTDLIKMTCITYLSRNRTEGIKLKNTLDAAFTIRNKIVHGERSYDVMDTIKIGGKKVAAQKVYWDIKLVVAHMIIIALYKMINTPGMEHLRFTFDDLLDNIYKARII